MRAATSSSHIILDRGMLAKNLAFIRSRMKRRVKLSAVIKGNAYGHGIREMIPMLENEGVNHFSVYGIEEAIAFHECASQDSKLMIMGYLSRDNLPWAISQGYEFFIYDLYQLEQAIEAAKTVGTPAQVHIEVETGMNRTGVDEHHIRQLADMVKDNEVHLVLSGICTHLAGAESISNYYRINNQIQRFKRYLKFFREREINFLKRHVACSAGMIRYPETQYDMVRVGIMLYGLWPSRETFIHYLNEHSHVKNGLMVDDPMSSILSWKTQVMTIKHVEIGEYIGYGTTYLANRPMTIAIIPVGYAYGYARELSNQGRVLIGGERVQVVGLVNMNMMAIDVTEIDHVKHGDEVVIIGSQGDKRITVSAFGQMSSQLNYELLSRLPHYIPRIIKD